MIKVTNLTHHLGGNEVLSQIDLIIPDGCIMGLVGVNGAGKSTLLRLMAGVYLPDVGFVKYNADSVSEESTRREIFFLPDDPYYTMEATPKSIVKMYRSFYPSMDLSLYGELARKYGIEEKKPLRNCSKGMRRQFYIALALSIKPKYLLLDEAFDGLDPLSRKYFKEEIIRMVEENDMTVVISSHSLRELEDFCDRYVLLDGHRVAGGGDIVTEVARFCKFQLAFTEEISEDRFSHLPVKSLQVQGRFVRVVLEGERDAMASALRELSPAVLEEMPMDFEETFIQEVEKGGLS